jgi:hypothetical protein
MIIFTRSTGDGKVNQPNKTDTGYFFEPDKGSTENVSVHNLNGEDNRQ